MPQITITYNCSTGAFDFNPSSQAVPYNANSSITWKVQGTQIPSGGSLKFPSTGGIVFKANSGWPGTTPAVDPSDPTKYSADDNNDSANTVGDFQYTTTLTVTDGQGNTTNPSYDPDIENEGAPPMVSRS